MLENIIERRFRNRTFTTKQKIIGSENYKNIIPQNKIENQKEKVKLNKMINFDILQEDEIEKCSGKSMRFNTNIIKDYINNPSFSFKSPNNEFTSVLSKFYPIKNEENLPSPLISKKRTRRKSVFQEKSYQLSKEKIPVLKKYKSQIITVKQLQKYKRVTTHYHSVKGFRSVQHKSNTKLFSKFKMNAKNLKNKNKFEIENEVLIKKYGLRKLQILNNTLDNFIRDNFLNIKQNNQLNIAKSNIRDYKDYKFVVELSQIDFSVDDFLDVIITIISNKNQNSLCEIKILENFLFLMNDIYNILMKFEKKFLQEQIYNLAFNLDYKNVPKDYVIYRYGDKAKNILLLLRGIVDSFIPQQQNAFLTLRNYEYYLGCLIMYNEFNLLSLVIKENYNILPINILDDINLFGMILENEKNENLGLLLKKIVNENKKIKALHALKNFDFSTSIKTEELLSELHINKNEKIIKISELLSIVIEEEFNKEQKQIYQMSKKKLSSQDLSKYSKSENNEDEKNEENKNNEIKKQKNEIIEKKNTKKTRKIINLSYKNKEKNLQLLIDSIIDRKDYKTNKDIDNVSSEEYISRINDSIIQTTPQKTSNILTKSIKLPIVIPKLTVYTYSKVSTIDIGSLLGQEALVDSNACRQATVITKNNFCDFGLISKKIYEQSLKYSLEKIKIETINNILSLKLFEGCNSNILKHRNMTNFSFVKYVKGEIINFNKYNDSDNYNNNENIYIITEGEFSLKAKLSLKDMNYLIRLYMSKYDNKMQFLNSFYYREFTIKDEIENLYQYYGEKKINEMLNKKHELYLYNLSNEEIIGLTYDKNDNFKMISEFFEYECLSQRATVIIIPKVTLNQIKKKFNVIQINEYKILQRYYIRMAKTLIGKRNDFLNEYQYFNGNNKFDFMSSDNNKLIREKNYGKNKLKNTAVKVELNDSYYNYKQLNEILKENKNKSKFEEKKLLNISTKVKYNKNKKTKKCLNLYNYFMQRSKEEKKKNNNSLSFGKIQNAINADKNFRDLLKDNLIFLDNEENENKNFKFSTRKNYIESYSKKKESSKFIRNIENSNEDFLNEEKNNKEIKDSKESKESKIIKSNKNNPNIKNSKNNKPPLIYNPIETQLNDSETRDIENSSKRFNSVKNRKFQMSFNNFKIRPKLYIKTADNYDFDDDTLYNKNNILNNKTNILFFEHKNNFGGVYDEKSFSKINKSLKYYNNINNVKYIDVNTSKNNLVKQGLLQKLNVFKVFMESAAMVKKGYNNKKIVSLNDMIWQKLTGDNDDYSEDKNHRRCYNLNNNTDNDFNWTDHLDIKQLNKIINENKILNKLSFSNNENEKSSRLSGLTINIKNRHKSNDLRSLQIRLVNERNQKIILKPKNKIKQKLCKYSKFNLLIQSINNK